MMNEILFASQQIQMQNFEVVSNKFNVGRICTDSLGLSSVVLFPINIPTF